MSAPTLDRHPGSSQAGSPRGRRPRKQLVLVASALIVLALSVGASLAIATRPVARQDPAATPAAAAEDQNTNANQTQTGTDQAATGTGQGTGTAQGTGTEAAAPALPDGDTPAYITKVDGANDRIVVDVVQVFKDDQAVKAAIADGKRASEAKYLTGWVRNENPRLRTLPLASNLDVRLLGGCEETGKDRTTVLTQLAEHAKRQGAYYFTLTVDGGKVTKIQENLAINAC